MKEPDNMESIEISEKNSEFWDELCGSHLAKSLGITDSSVMSLKKFDTWYYDFYPYLIDHIPFADLKNKRVLEIGLGYGTVSQSLVEAGADYTGLDIAEGPVSMVRLRLAQNSLPGTVFKGSILDPQFSDSHFDYVIAIGCLHHTGNLELAIQQCYRLLKPGGKLIFMVYYAYSYRRFRMVPSLTIQYKLREIFGYRGVVGGGSETQRAAYDASSDGGGAPHTDWISKNSLMHYCRSFSSFKSTIENIDQEFPFHKTKRINLLKTKWPSIFGLDIYVSATK